jgi:glycosyltransferase involved in cell wall biosynthesis
VEFSARGGMIHYTYQLCRGLAAAGADVTLLTGRHYELDAMPHPFRLQKRLRLWDARPAGPGPGRLVRSVRRIGRALAYYREWVRAILYLRALRFDVVQLGDLRFAGNLACLFAMRAAGIHPVAVCHNVRRFASHSGGGAFHFGLLEQLAYRLMYRLLRLVVVHFEVNRREFLTTFGLPPERVVAIPHGNQAIFEELRDKSLTGSSVRSRLGLHEDAAVVMFFGSLSFYKGVDLLLEAFARVRERRPRARLVVAGQALSGFDHAGLVARAAELGIPNDVRFETGYVPSCAVPAWIEAASVVVFPYRDIHQSGAVHVAQTLGAPLVVTDVGAMVEVVRDRLTGLVVPPHDVAALARAVSELLDDEALARRLGAAAARDARERFGWEGIGHRLLASYQAIAAPATDPAPRTEG